MAVQFSDDLLDTLLAPGISHFDKATIPMISGIFPETDYWISNLFLNSLFGDRYKVAWQQAAISFLFRTQNAARAYQSASALTAQCVDAFQPGRPATRLYFRAVSEWETVVINIQLSLDLFLKFIGKGVAETDDAERIRLSVNRIKHFGEDVAKRKDAETTLPMWLAADRLQTRLSYILYSEIAENIEEMSKACDILQNPNEKL